MLRAAASTPPGTVALLPPPLHATWLPTPAQTHTLLALDPLSPPTAAVTGEVARAAVTELLFK
ncbi:hypothetical protein ACS0TY_023601 [Phlomoides rotata]